MKLKLNVRLLRKIQHHILEEPRRFFMSGLMLKAKNQDDWTEKVEWHSDLSSKMPPCGTVACIAGWANILSGHPHQTLVGAIRELRLATGDYNKDDAGDFLFFNDSWPEPYRRQFAEAKTPRKRARIASNRIEYLIKTGK